MLGYTGLRVGSPISRKLLTADEESVLSRGLNFAPTPKSLPVPRIIAAVEDGLRRTSADETRKEEVRHAIVGVLRKTSLSRSNLLSGERKAIKSLHEDDTILILPAGKGRSTVVLDRTEYDRKLDALLSDENTYKPLSRDPAPAFERRMNQMLLSLKRAGAIQPSLYFRLRSSAGRTPLLYGLPKIHTTRALASHRVVYWFSELPPVETSLVPSLPSGRELHVLCQEFCYFVESLSTLVVGLMVSYDMLSLCSPMFQWTSLVGWRSGVCWLTSLWEIGHPCHQTR